MRWQEVWTGIASAVLSRVTRRSACGVRCAVWLIRPPSSPRRTCSAHVDVAHEQAGCIKWQLPADAWTKLARLSYQSCGSLFLLAEDAPERRTTGCTLEESRSRRDSGCCGPLKPPATTTPWSCIAQVAKAWRAVRRSASVAAHRTRPKGGCRSVTFSEWEASIGDEDDFSLLDGGENPEGQEGQGSPSPSPQTNTIVVPLSQVSSACSQAQTAESAGEPC